MTKNKTANEIIIRDLNTGRIARRGFTIKHMGLVCLLVREAAERGERWGWEECK